MKYQNHKTYRGYTIKAQQIKIVGITDASHFDGRAVVIDGTLFNTEFRIVGTDTYGVFQGPKIGALGKTIIVNKIKFLKPLFRVGCTPTAKQFEKGDWQEQFPRRAELDW
jgi:hypothetical protein